eukprot:3853614-Alexandrium_andersonii.AAC.1
MGLQGACEGFAPWPPWHPWRPCLPWRLWPVRRSGGRMQVAALGERKLQPLGGASCRPPGR